MQTRCSAIEQACSYVFIVLGGHGRPRAEMPPTLRMSPVGPPVAWHAKHGCAWCDHVRKARVCAISAQSPLQQIGAATNPNGDPARAALGSFASHGDPSRRGSGCAPTTIAPSTHAKKDCASYSEHRPAQPRRQISLRRKTKSKWRVSVTRFVIQKPVTESRVWNCAPSV